MSIKHYCDCCMNEITDKNKIDGGHFRLTGELADSKGIKILDVEVITAKEGTWNDGDFCKYCVIEAIKRADDRPKASRGL